MQNGMAAKFIEPLRDKITFISGSSKSAGKTTFLNYLLPRMRKLSNIAFLTIGVDGERKDQIYGTDKPVIETTEGDILVTSEKMLNSSDGSFCILQVFPWKTVLGKLVLVRTKRKGHIEIVGPENNLQLELIIEFIKEELGIRTILIDGAINRITQVSTGQSAGFYYVCRITQDNVKSVLDKMKVLSMVCSFGTYKKGITAQQTFFLDGALTVGSLDAIPNNIKIIIVKDFTKIFLNYNQLLEAEKKYTIYLENVLRLEAFVINLFNISKNEFTGIMQKTDIIQSCIFNPFEIRE